MLLVCVALKNCYLALFGFYKSMFEFLWSQNETYARDPTTCILHIRRQIRGWPCAECGRARYRAAAGGCRPRALLIARPAAIALACHSLCGVESPGIGGIPRRWEARRGLELDSLLHQSNEPRWVWVGADQHLLEPRIFPRFHFSLWPGQPFPPPTLDTCLDLEQKYWCRLDPRAVCWSLMHIWASRVLLNLVPSLIFLCAQKAGSEMKVAEFSDCIKILCGGNAYLVCFLCCNHWHFQTSLAVLKQ